MLRYVFWWINTIVSPCETKNWVHDFCHKRNEWSIILFAWIRWIRFSTTAETASKITHEYMNSSNVYTNCMLFERLQMKYRNPLVVLYGCMRHHKENRHTHFEYVCGMSISGWKKGKQRMSIYVKKDSRHKSR